MTFNLTEPCYSLPIDTANIKTHTVLISHFVQYSMRYYSLQGVATYDMRFVDVFAGWPGISHDARVFRNNPLYRTLPHRLRHRNVNRLAETFHIVGDSAFPLSPQVLTPFKRRRGHALNDVQKKYNTHLASKRNVSILHALF